MFNVTNAKIHHWTCSTCSLSHIRSHNWFLYPYYATQASKRSKRFIFIHIPPHILAICPAHFSLIEFAVIPTLDNLWKPWRYLLCDVQNCLHTYVQIYFWSLCFWRLVMVKQISDYTPVFIYCTRMELQWEGIGSILAFFPELIWSSSLSSILCKVTLWCTQLYLHAPCMPRDRNSFLVTQICHKCKKYHFLYVLCTIPKMQF